MERRGIGPRRQPDTVGLEWEDPNEEHVGEHFPSWSIDELIEGNGWLADPNHRDHPPEHVLLIGRGPGGRFVTAVLRRPSNDSPGFWRPITSWLSTDTERRRHRAARNRSGGLGN